MKVAFDIDGPIVNLENFMLENGSKYFKRLYAKKYYKNTGVKIKISDINDDDVIVNINGMYIKDIFDCDKDTEEAFWTKNMVKYILTKPRKNIREMLEMLKLEDDTPANLTARAKTAESGFTGALMRFLVRFYNTIWRLPIDEIHFISSDNDVAEKTAFCKDNDIPILIDDTKEIAESVAMNTNTQALLSPTRNNQTYQNDAIPRVEDADAIYREIFKYKAKQFPFEFLSREKREEMSLEALEEYYSKMREYYINTTFCKKYIDQTERQYKRLSRVGKPIFDGLLKYEVENADLIPKEDGLILTFNHCDYIDTPLIFRIMDQRPTHVIAKKELDDELVGKILRYSGSIRTDRNVEESRNFAKDMAIRTVLKGGNVLISPEGTRNIYYSAVQSSKLAENEYLFYLDKFGASNYKTRKAKLKYESSLIAILKAKEELERRGYCAVEDEPLLSFDGRGSVSIAQKSGGTMVNFAISKAGNRRRLVRVCGIQKVGVNENLEDANIKLRESLLAGLKENELQIQKSLRYVNK